MNATPTLGHEQQRAWGALLIAHAALTRVLTRIMQAEGLPGLEVYDVLLALEDAPEGRLRMCDLADAVVFSPSGLTRLIDRLEKSGWVRREAHPTDRRSLFAVLTPEGLAVRKAAWPRYRELLQEHFGAHLSDEEARTISEALFRLPTKRRVCEAQPE